MRGRHEVITVPVDAADEESAQVRARRVAEGQGYAVRSVITIYPQEGQDYVAPGQRGWHVVLDVWA